MTDEKFVFISDSAEKKRVARGVHNRVTHGGRVKTSSDFLSKKELQKMNGECKSYRLNEPMTWSEFKELPDDLKVSYINAIRIRFGPSDSEIFRMLGVDQRRGALDFKKLNLDRGRGAKHLKFNKDAWFKWRSGIKEGVETNTEDNEFNARSLMADDEPIEEPTAEPIPEPTVQSLPTTKNRIFPLMGHMILRGTVEEISEAITEMLGGGSLVVDMNWRVEVEHI